MVYFHNKLLRGNRCVKADSGAFDAFHSPNLPPLAELEIKIKGTMMIFLVSINRCKYIIVK